MDTFITPSDTAAGKRPFLFYYYNIYIVFYSMHAGDDCYNSNAPFCIFAASARSSLAPCALLSFGHHFAETVLYTILY